MSFNVPKDIFALDLGTTKFCLAHLNRFGEGQSPNIETISVNAGGMHRGMLADLDAAKGSLMQLLEIGEKQFNRDIRKVVTGVAGSHLRSRIESATMTISTASVEPLTIVKLETELKEKHFSKDRELLHCVPLAYRLDQRPWTSSPVGFSGHEITGQFMLIEADKLYLADVVKLLNECGLEVLSLAAEPYASSIVTTGEEFKKLGSVIIDIGGGTTDGMIFQAGKPIKLFTINIGGKLMTNDLAIGLGVSIEEAEKIKIRFGLRTNQSELKLQVKNLRGQSKIISWQDVYPILAPRISELADLVHDEIKPYLSGLGAGLVVTGGGSEVMGICDFIGLHLPMSAKKAFPELQQAIRTIKANNQLKPQLSTKYATVVGLLALETIKQHEGRKHQKSSWTSRYVDLFVNWLKDLS